MLLLLETQGEEDETGVSVEAGVAAEGETNSVVVRGVVFFFFSEHTLLSGLASTAWSKPAEEMEVMRSNIIERVDDVETLDSLWL